MKQNILDAAMYLFINEGYENVSIRKIASKIQYSPGTIYLYFKDKSEIFYAIQEVGLSLLYQRQLSIQSIPDPFERLKEHAKVYIEFALENKEYYEIMFISKDCINIICETKDWPSGNRSFEILVQNIAQCQEVGLFPDKNPLEFGVFIWSLVHGFASLEISQRLLTLEKHGFSIETSIEKIVSLFEVFK